MAALGWSPTVGTYLGRVPNVLGWRRDGVGFQPGAVSADRGFGGLRPAAEGERAGGDRVVPDGAGARVTRSAPLFRDGPRCLMCVGPRPSAAEIAPFRHGRAFPGHPQRHRHRTITEVISMGCGASNHRDKPDHDEGGILRRGSVRYLGFRAMSVIGRPIGQSLKRTFSAERRRPLYGHVGRPKQRPIF
jgi:hypothetical protein